VNPPIPLPPSARTVSYRAPARFAGHDLDVPANVGHATVHRHHLINRLASDAGSLQGAPLGVRLPIIGQGTTLHRTRPNTIR
jgi:hypothetical protein